MRRDSFAVGGNEVDALVRSVVACDITQVAFDASGRLDARNGAERQVEVLEIGNAVDTLAPKVIKGLKAFRFHPVREAVAKVFDDPETVVHRGCADLQA